MNGDVIPCLGGVSFLVLLFGLITFFRFLSYREKIALAEKGLVRPGPTRGNGKDTLRWGIVIISLGLALCLGLYPLGFAPDFSGSSSGQFPLHFGPWMLIGLIPTFFGVGLVLIYVLTREEKSRDEQTKTDKEEPPRAT